MNTPPHAKNSKKGPSSASLRQDCVSVAIYSLSPIVSSLVPLVRSLQQSCDLRFVLSSGRLTIRLICVVSLKSA